MTNRLVFQTEILFYQGGKQIVDFLSNVLLNKRFK